MTPFSSMVLLLSALLLFYAAPLQTSYLDTVQCPCVLMPDGSCFQYDFRYMAASLEEALVSFPDLSLLDPPDPVDVKPGQMTKDSYCSSTECLICQEDIRERVTEVGLANFTTGKIGSAVTNVTCTRYGFTRYERRYGTPKKACRRHGSSESDDDSSGECDCKQKQKRSRNRFRNRSQRQATTLTEGTRFLLACSKKGAEGYTGTEPVSLCSSCWTWRVLPEEYFPRIINELVCDDADRVCLSGYASCASGMHNVEVLRNQSGTYSQITLTAGTYCECKIAPSSVLYSLVNGSGIASSLPPI